ncbi:MAG: calcium/sodium antiporter [Planctomycetes bacterium]|nr:calcium/sodium antiporter [Planctomycetota bacterium]
MEPWLTILKLVGGLGILLLGADLLVRGATRFAASVGIKPVIIGLTLVAYGTSAPELSIGVNAALRGDSGIRTGDVIGSNIANIGLILGLVSLVRPIRFDPDLFKRDIPAMLTAAVLLGTLPFIGGPRPLGEELVFILHPWIAVLFLALLLGLQEWMRRSAREGADPPPENARSWRRRGLLLLWTLAGLCALIFGGVVFVQGAAGAAAMLGVPQLLIGLTVVAVGTSAPELATSLVAAARGQGDIAAGNVVGSNTFNILLVLGLTSLIAPLPIEVRAMQFDMPVMLGFSVLLVFLTWRRRELSRVGGGILLSLYALYIANLFFEWY